MSKSEPTDSGLVKALSQRDLLVLAFGAMIGWGRIVLSGQRIDEGSVLLPGDIRRRRSTSNNLYHRRNMNETVNAAIKRKFAAFVRSRVWWKQFREPVIKCAVHNVERTLAVSHEE